MQQSKLTLMFVLVGLVCILSVARKSQAVMSGNVYDFKNAEIILETAAPMNKITKKVSVGEAGKYVKEETTNEINAFGMKRRETQISYTDREKDMVYNYNPETNEATAVDISQVTDGAKKNNMSAFDKESLEKWGGKVLRQEKYQGLDCTVVEFTNFMSTVWFHKKYPVRMISNVGGMETKTELVSFNEGAAKDYKLPAGAKIGKAQSIGEIMGQANAYKNNPEYQRSKKAAGNERDYLTADEMSEAQKAMKQAGSEMQDAMKALSDMFGGNQ